jgi:mannose-6-phosphate isomerase-like protein (cupin superfamily)
MTKEDSMALAPVDLAVEAKVWGSVRHCFSSEAASGSVLWTVAGAFCSRHSHEDRVNRFVVVSGEIRVEIFDDRGRELLRAIPLRQGRMIDVPAGVVHRFVVVEPGVVVEFYFPAREGAVVRGDDIKRLDYGGRG